MPVARRDPDETIAELYRAAAGTAPWARALQRVVDDLDALGAQLIGVDKRTGAIIFNYADETHPAEAPLEYIRNYHAVDPRVPLLAQKPVGDWLFCQDHFDDRFAARNPYYRDLLIPSGGRYSASVKLAESATEVIMVAFLSKGTAPPFDQAQREYFHRVGRHLQEALQMHRRLKEVVSRGAVGAALIARITRPLGVVDGERHLTATNPMFDELLAEGGIVRRVAGALACVNAAIERALTAAMDDLRHTPAQQRRARVISLGREAKPVFAFSVAMLVPDETLHAFGDTAQYLVTAHQRPRAAPHDDVSLWQAAFNFSPAEARVAAHLFGGKAPKEIARALHLSPSTIKSHLDALFAKTGTSRQAELVRVLSMGD